MSALQSRGEPHLRCGRQQGEIHPTGARADGGRMTPHDDAIPSELYSAKVLRQLQKIHRVARPNGSDDRSDDRATPHWRRPQGGRGSPYGPCDLPVRVSTSRSNARHYPGLPASLDSAIRWAHLADGYGDPLQVKPRLSLNKHANENLQFAIPSRETACSLIRRATKRISDPVKAKSPVAPDMLRLIYRGITRH